MLQDETIQTAIREISEIHQIHPAVLLGRQRAQKYLPARQHLAKSLDALGMSSPQIGAVMNRDHTTVLYYLGKIPSKRKAKRS